MALKRTPTYPTRKGIGENLSLHELSASRTFLPRSSIAHGAALTWYWDSRGEHRFPLESQFQKYNPFKSAQL